MQNINLQDFTIGNYSLSRFNPNCLKNHNKIIPNNILIIGKKLSGKTTLILDLLNSLKYEEIIANIFSYPILNKYDNIIKNEYICKGPTKSQIVNYQNNIEKISEINYKNNLKKRRTLSVFDDLFYSYPNIDSIDKLIINSNYYNHINLMTTQYSKILSPRIRNNIDLIFVFKRTIDRDINNIYNDYINPKLSLNTFRRILQALPNHSFFVINQINNKQPQFQYYVAEPNVPQHQYFIRIKDYIIHLLIRNRKKRLLQRNLINDLVNIIFDYNKSNSDIYHPYFDKVNDILYDYLCDDIINNILRYYRI